MAGVIFDRVNLQELKDGIDSLFVVLGEIMEMAQTDIKATSEPHQFLMDKLHDVHEDHWSSIRTKFLREEYIGYHHGNFTKEETHDPGKMFLDFIQQVEFCREAVHEKVEEELNREKELKMEIRKLLEKNAEVEAEIRDTKWKHSQDVIELKALQKKYEHLEEVVKKKTTDVQELQRAGNVQLWQKEKGRLLEKVSEREKKLETEMIELKRENSSLLRQLQNADAEFKKYKMAEDKKKASGGDEAEQETEELKRLLFTLQKDVQRTESELFKQQKHIIGIIQGFKKDFKVLIERFMSENGGILPADVLSRRDIDVMRQRLERVISATAEGRLSYLLAELPTHYMGIDRDIKVPTSVKKMTPQERLNQLLGTKASILTPGLKAAQPLPPIAKNKEAEKDTKSDKSTEQSRDSENPQLVDPKTGKLKSITVIKHFPFMAMSYIQDQWEQFKKYDTSGDGELDITEIMQAIMPIVGEDFTAEQVQEAIHEIDLDQTNTIDFYEYLLISNLLINKTGKAHIFRSGIAQEKAKIVSKTCSIQ
ncbi:median body protein isoform X2 [Lingula anatina]|nr:median body protein isoform X2 [Lingula anatina]|eukprot:XP_013421211.1 median body protein isoform X2 [Lingula anatina]